MACVLEERQCKACKDGVPPLRGRNQDVLGKELGNGWKIVDEHHLEKMYLFKDFREALTFTDRVGALAEEQGHHPDIYLAWDKVTLILWTHKIDGLSDSDFVFAAKADRLL